MPLQWLSETTRKSSTLHLWRYSQVTQQTVHQTGFCALHHTSWAISNQGCISFELVHCVTGTLSSRLQCRSEPAVTNTAMPCYRLWVIRSSENCAMSLMMTWAWWPAMSQFDQTPLALSWPQKSWEACSTGSMCTMVMCCLCVSLMWKWAAMLWWVRYCCILTTDTLHTCTCHTQQGRSKGWGVGGAGEGRAWGCLHAA